jgi:hypothetical protein
MDVENGEQTREKFLWLLWKTKAEQSREEPSAVSERGLGEFPPGSHVFPRAQSGEKN